MDRSSALQRARPPLIGSVGVLALYFALIGSAWPAVAMGGALACLAMLPAPRRGGVRRAVRVPPHGR